MEGVWDEEGRGKFRGRIGKVKTNSKDWEGGKKEMERRIKEVLEEIERSRKERWEGDGGMTSAGGRRGR